MRLLVYTAPSPAEDLALEEAMQLELEEGRAEPGWRVWQAVAPAVVLGTGQEHAREVNLDAARAAGVPVLRRHSGGGAVLIGPGIINYSGFFRLAELPGSQTISGAMQAGLQPVLAALLQLGVKAELAGLADLAVRTAGFRIQDAGCREQQQTTQDSALKKITGNAQARKRVSVLVHGTLLADPDWTLMERVLKFPTRAPEYRQDRGHRAFLTSLKELGVPSDLTSFVQMLRAALSTVTAVVTDLSHGEKTKVHELFASRYSRENWHLRR